MRSYRAGLSGVRTLVRRGEGQPGRNQAAKKIKTRNRRISKGSRGHDAHALTPPRRVSPNLGVTRRDPLLFPPFISPALFFSSFSSVASSLVDRWFLVAMIALSLYFPHCFARPRCYPVSSPPISITRIRLELSASVQLPHRLPRELVAAGAQGLGGARCDSKLTRGTPQR